jgi:acyl carrier protein
MHITQLKHEIRFFIVENFLYGLNDDGLTDSVSFLANGLIDSTGVLELVSFVENKYGISVKDDELIPDNFDSVNNLSNFIQKKTGNIDPVKRMGLETGDGQVTPCINIPS